MSLKDYCKPLEDILDELKGKDERDDWPKRNDLYPDKIYINKTDIVDTQTLLNDQRYCLVEGAERRGKTTLARYIGLQYSKDWHVFRIDMSQVKDENDINEFIIQLFGGMFDRQDVLIIIEDCHIKPEITEKLLKNVCDCRKAHFLFTARTVIKTGKLPIEDPFLYSIIRENDYVVRLDASEDTIHKNINGIVDKFVENNRSNLISKSKPSPTTDDYSFLVEQTGGNKRILKYYLEAWLKAEDSGLPLRKTGRKQVLERFYQERLKGLSPVQLEVLKPMSVLGQFEIPILIQPLFPSDVFQATQEVSSLKGLAFKFPPDRWLLADTESKLTLECMNVNDAFSYSIIKMYVLGAPNYYEVFVSLHRAWQSDILNLLAADEDIFNSLIRRMSNSVTPLSEMLYVLRAIAWANKTKALALWRECKKQTKKPFFDEVQRKLTDAQNLTLTTNLLVFLEIIDREGEAVPLINILPVELFMSKSELEKMSIQSVKNRMTRIRTLFPEKFKQVLKYLDESDYVKLAEKSGEPNLQHISFFLRLLSDDEELKYFGFIYLNALGERQVINLIRSKNLAAFNTFERYAGRIDMNWVKRLTERAEFPWDELFTNSDISNISYCVYGWVQNHDEKLREQLRNIVRHWSIAALFSEKYQKLIIKHIGRLLQSMYYFDRDVAKRLTDQVITVFDLETAEYTLEHLTQLIRNSRWCNRDAAQQLIDKIFSHDVIFLSSKGELHWFCRLLWEAVLSNELRTKDWVNEVSESFWEELAASASPSDTFYLLLVLSEINKDLGKKIAQVVVQRLLTSPKTMDDPYVMPLLGLLAYHDLKLKVTFSFPPAEKMTELCTYPSNQRLAFSLLCLQDSKPDLIPDFMKALQSIIGITTGIIMLLAEYPLPWTSKDLEDILLSTRNETMRDTENVYDRMILLYRSIHVQTRIIYMGTLIKEMCSSQFVRRHELSLKAEDDTKLEEFKTRSWATIRLNNAIDNSIFTVQNTKNPFTYTASRSLVLNRGNSCVVFALNVTEHLLLALNNTQRVEECGTLNAWDRSFNSIWTMEPLLKQQLRYWQRILIMMDVIKVDYQEMKNNKWIITFRVNDKHPLAKSIVSSK